MTELQVLVVQHEEDVPLGLFGEWLTDAGCMLEICRPDRGEDIPGIGEYDALIVVGGTKDADSDLDWPWLPMVRKRIVEAVADKLPTLGICLGHQLIALALGGEVGRNPGGRLIGIHPIGWVRRAGSDRLMGSLDAQAAAVQWNQDIVTRLPSGAVVLAESPDGTLQAARFADQMWGIQVHPEADADIVQAWAGDSVDSLAGLGLTVESIVAQVAEADAELRARWRPLADGFARIAREHTRRDVDAS